MTWRDLAISLLVIAVFDSCYDAHAAAPCHDAGEAAPEATTQAHGQGAVTAGSAASTYPGPCPFAYDHVHCWCVDATHEVCGAPCAGPIVAGECYADIHDVVSR